METLKVRGIILKDAAYAKALEAQGLISTEELEKKLPNLDPGTIDLIGATDMRRRNLHKPIIPQVIRLIQGFRKK
ncbi:MAG: hypothetical protein QY322_02695 [bacterium]|nr:MAG: hypothetical protein QY322_02695 [bacterium]